MVSPIDYTSAFTNPVEKFAEGYKLVTGIQQMQDQRALQAQQRERLNTMLERVQSPNATAQDYIGLSAVLPPDQAKAMNDTIAAMDKRKQESMLSESMQILSALRSGKPAIAKSLIEQRAAAERNSGNEPGAKFLDTMASVSELDGEALIPFYASMVSAIPGGKDALTALTSYEKAPGEARKTEAEARLKEQEAALYQDKTQAEIQSDKALAAQRKADVDTTAKRLNLDRDRLNFDIEAKIADLAIKRNPNAKPKTDAQMKLTNDAITKSVVATKSADQMRDLAGTLEGTELPRGRIAGGVSNWFKTQMGSEDADSMIRKEYIRIKNSMAIKSLPPGPATDKDIQIMLSGFPGEDANPKILASFLRGMAKIQDLEAATEGARGEWADVVGHLGAPKEDIEIDGIPVKAGTNFAKFAPQYMRELNRRQSAPPQTSPAGGGGAQNPLGLRLVSKRPAGAR